MSIIQFSVCIVCKHEAGFLSCDLYHIFLFCHCFNALLRLVFLCEVHSGVQVPLSLATHWCQVKIFVLISIQLMTLLRHKYPA